MNKKIRIALIVVFLVLAAWAVRFVTLNVEARKTFANTIYYEMGEKIAFEKDFFRTEDANMDGYSILVKSAAIYPYETFAEMMNLELPPQGVFFRADYVYDVEVTIFNEDNEEGGIDMFNTALIHAGLGMRVDNTLWELLYPQLQGSYTFRARTHSQMDFHFPFVIETELNQRAYDLERLKTTPFFLNLTEYPNQKRVRVGPLE